MNVRDVLRESGMGATEKAGCDASKISISGAQRLQNRLETATVSILVVWRAWSIHGTGIGSVETVMGLRVRYSRSSIHYNEQAAFASDDVRVPRMLEERLGASWLRVVDVRFDADDRPSGARLRHAVDEPRFCEASRGTWIRSGAAPAPKLRPPGCYLRGHVPDAVSLDVAGRLFDEAHPQDWMTTVVRRRNG